MKNKLKQTKKRQQQQQQQPPNPPSPPPKLNEPCSDASCILHYQEKTQLEIARLMVLPSLALFQC